jgi:hypothetical protein
MSEIRDWTIVTLDLLLPLLTAPGLPVGVGAFVAGVTICPCDTRRPIWPVQVAQGAALGLLTWWAVVAIQSLII